MRLKVLLLPAFGLLVGSALLYPSSAHALVSNLTRDELVEAADTVVELQVIDTAVRYGERPVGSLRPMIMTDVRVRTNRVLKGSVPREFIVSQPGGTLDGLTLVVSDVPRFAPGERCVVFLDKAGVIGGSQGKLEIVDGTVPEWGMSLLESLERIGSSVHGKAFSASSDPMRSNVTGLADALGVTSDSSIGSTVVALAPAVTSISPARVNAGIGDVITISGSGFGDIRGTGRVDFLIGNALNGSRVSAAVYRSWSDGMIVCEVPELAESGLARVVTSDGLASGATLIVGFSANGTRWSSLPVTYSINENCADLVGERAAMQRAMQTWSSGGSNYRVQAGGASSSSAYPPAYGGGNTMYFTSDPDFPSSALAMNYYWYSGSTMLQSNIIFADIRTWVDGIGAGFDVETVALHELGHSVGLDDQYGDAAGVVGGNGEVMAAGASNYTRRLLSQAEIEGAIHQYGSDGTYTPSAPVVGSISHPSETIWYGDRSPEFVFSAVGAQAYSHVLDGSPTTVPDMIPEAASTVASYTGLSDGEWYFHVRGVGSTGNWGATTTRMVRIDQTNPTSSLSGPDSSIGSLSFSLSATDENAGVASIIYQVDGGEETAYVAPVSVSALGNHTLAFWAVDSAGNTEAPNHATFSVMPRGDVTIQPIQGADRFETAVETSKLGFDTGSDTVLIATGRNWPDALGASSLAGALDAPILLVEKSLIPAAVTDEIERLGATKAIIIGGTGAVDDDVKNRLLKTGAIDNVRRIAGTDRYDTARKVAAETIAAAGASFDGTVFVATGQNYADALAASPAAAANNWPTLLVPSNSAVPAATLSFVGTRADTVVILGGTSAVSYTAWQDLWSELDGAGVTRIGGSDRFDTAVKVADWSVAYAGLSYASPALATGRSPYDALAGGVVQGRDGSVLLLTENTTLPSSTAAALADHTAQILEVRFLGGLGAVGQSVRDAVEALVAP